MSGIFGVASRNNCSELIFYGTDYHSHLGTEYGGLATLDEHFHRQIHNINQSQFKSKFFDVVIPMTGNKCVGLISAFEEQPIYLNSKFGPFSIVTNGLVENIPVLTTELLKKGISFSEVRAGSINPTELVAKLITQGDDLIDGIENMFQKIEGAMSLLLLNKDGVWAIRDRYSHWPLIIGQSNDAWAVITETSSFPNIGDVNHGIIMRMNPTPDRLKMCRNETFF